MNCHEALQWLGAEPSAAVTTLPAPLQAHLAGCGSCQRYAQEMRTLDGSIKRALEVDLAKFYSAAAPPDVVELRPRGAAAPSRRKVWALAASVLLSVGIGAGLWALRSETSLASAVIEHMAEEPGSWSQTAVIGETALAGVLRHSGVQINGAHTPVVYAASCSLRGHTVPHLVVSTDQGPITVILLRAERISSPREFNEGGYRGVLWPAPDGHGSIAVLARAPQSGDLALQARSISAQLQWVDTPAAVDAG